jgi:hypothetical protein
VAGSKRGRRKESGKILDRKEKRRSVVCYGYLFPNKERKKTKKTKKIFTNFLF